jgi:hypothetical protein
VINSKFSGYSPGQYITTLTRMVGMVGLARVELATNGLGNRCSIHLSYSPSSIDYYSFTPLTADWTSALWANPPKPLN